MATAVTDINVSLVESYGERPSTIVVVEAAIAIRRGRRWRSPPIPAVGRPRSLPGPARGRAADRRFPFGGQSRSFSIPRLTRLRAASEATSANEKLRAAAGESPRENCAIVGRSILSRDCHFGGFLRAAASGRDMASALLSRFCTVVFRPGG